MPAQHRGAAALDGAHHLELGKPENAVLCDFRDLIRGGMG
jgi:hypothetical protein